MYVYLDMPGALDKAKLLGSYLSRIPRQHASSVYPIFVMDQKPRGGPGGGTWRPGEVEGGVLGGERGTGIPDADIERLVIEPGFGMIGIPRSRWRRPMGLVAFTVLHEVGHSVDYGMNLSAPGVRVDDFRGVRPTCGAGNAVKRRVVEAYARYVLRARRICRDAHPGETDAEADRRVVRHLLRSPAFSGVPGRRSHSSGR